MISLLISTCNRPLSVSVEYILPLIQLVAVISNIFNASIFSSPKKNPSYKYLRTISIIDSIIFIIFMIQTHLLCKRSANIILTYWYQFYYLFVKYYILRVFMMLSSILKIQIAINRYLITTDKYNNTQFKTRIVFFFLFSLLFYLPNIVTNKIYKIQVYGNDSYEIVSNEHNEDMLFNNYTSEPYLYTVYLTEFVNDRKEIKFSLVLLQNIFSIVFSITVILLNIQIYRNYTKSRKIQKENLRRTLVVKYERNTNKTECTLSGSVAIQENNSNANINKKDKIKLMAVWIPCFYIIDETLKSLFNTLDFTLKRRSFIHLSCVALILFLETILSLSNSVFYFIFYQNYREIVKQFWLLILFYLVIIVSFICLVTYLILL